MKKGDMVMTYGENFSIIELGQLWTKVKNAEPDDELREYRKLHTGHDPEKFELWRVNLIAYGRFMVSRWVHPDYVLHYESKNN